MVNVYKDKDKVYNGTVSIARRQEDFDLRNPNYDPNRDYFVEIDVADEQSGHKFFKIKLRSSELVNALTGLHGRPCTFEINPETLELIGHKREHMTFAIRDRKDKPMVIPSHILEAGWGYTGGYGNHHARRKDDNGKSVYMCSFHRYIAPADEEADSNFDDEPDLPWNTDPLGTETMLTPSTTLKKKAKNR